MNKKTATVMLLTVGFALCSMAATRMKPLFISDVTDSNGLLRQEFDQLSTEEQVEGVSNQVAVVDAILRAYVSGDILAEAESYTAEILNTHETNDVVHVTQAERGTWNAKQDALPYQTNAIPASVIANAPWLLSFTELDPNVPEWAKASSKPSYSYSEISGTPTTWAWSALTGVPTTWAWDSVSGKPSFATVATSGEYSDLSGKPTLATVATSGSYTDLSNKPTIPTVPTVVSAFSNDAGYLVGDVGTLTNDVDFVEAVAAVSPPTDLTGYATETWVGQQGYMTSYTESDPNAAGIASNVVTQAYIREQLGVYLYIGQDGGIYVHTNTEE